MYSASSPRVLLLDRLLLGDCFLDIKRALLPSGEHPQYPTMLAYCHDNLPTDRKVTHNCEAPDPRPATAELLNALKYRIYSRHKSSQSLVDQFKAISQELDFPSESEILTFSVTYSDMESVKEMVDFYTRERVIEPFDILWMFTRGSAFLDIEEPWTKSTIRLTIREGEPILIPAGAYRHYTLNVNPGSDIRMWGMYKTSDKAVLKADLPPLIFGEEAEQHPVRKAYLESIIP
ncbi:hypothetical protein L218DRAFT_1081571 [Marasmius fiardii PR-910]|nr:hypothetical protein L218DRAFT_1081571 [Marasmius fiardii PR-910]